MSFEFPRKSSLPALGAVARFLQNVTQDATALVLPMFYRQGARVEFWFTLLFVLGAVIPTVTAGAYWSLVATPQYTSEAQMVVRNAIEDPLKQLGNDAMSSVLSVISGGQASAQDAYIISRYIGSRAIIDDLGGKNALLKVFGRASVDRLSRLDASSSLEDVWKYWRRHVDPVIDVPSGIITLDVRAFAPKDAQALADKVVKLSERLVNQISERTRGDALNRARIELENARVMLNGKRQELLEFRNRQSTLDPFNNAQALGGILLGLQKDKLKLESEIASLGNSMTADSPAIRALLPRLEILNKQIQAIQAYMASELPNSGVMSDQIGQYEKLQLEQKFAERLYEVAESAFARAQEDIIRQQIYLVTVVRPSMPEKVSYPRPLLDTFLVFIWGTILWSVISLTAAGVRDHR